MLAKASPKYDRNQRS